MRDTNGLGDRRASKVLIRSIRVRYEDGRKMCLVPEAKEELFSQDDAHRLVGFERRLGGPKVGAGDR